MNSEAVSYRLNDPLTWAEFKAMPDDIKVLYITALRGKYNVPDTHIAKMMGISQKAMSTEMIRLNCNQGRGSARGKWDKNGFYSWCCAEKNNTIATEQPGTPPIVEPSTIVDKATKAIPCSGNMTFVGSVDAALDALKIILGGASVKFTVAWDALPEGCGSDG